MLQICLPGQGILIRYTLLGRPSLHLFGDLFKQEIRFDFDHHADAFLIAGNGAFRLGQNFVELRLDLNIGSQGH